MTSLEPTVVVVSRLFADFLRRQESGEGIDLEGFCAQHPEHAVALRERYRRFAEPRRTDGADADHSVETAGLTGDDPAWAAFLTQLRSRGPGWQRYRYQGEIARGGMGAVHRVWDADARRHLALKIILGQAQESASGATPSVDHRTLGRFLEEAQVTSQLDHPGIVPVHEIGVDGAGRVYFTMKLVKGDDLRVIYDKVAKREEGWTRTRALHVLLKVCEAMTYAHAKGVIHRDLKPANVMVGRYGEVYVMDWGLARVLHAPETKDIRLRVDTAASDGGVLDLDSPPDESSDGAIETMDGDVVGTPAYMPPEQARGELENLKPWSDVYAVGAMLYHLLAGQAPYAEGAEKPVPRAVLKKLIKRPPRSLARIAPRSPPELIAICEKAMMRLPGARYPTMAELGNEIRAWLEHRVVRAYESGKVAEAKKWLARNRALAATALLAILVIGALFAWSWLAILGREQDAQKMARRWQIAAAEADDARKTARVNELSAATRTRELEDERSKLLRASDVKRLGDLREEFDRVWPADEDHVAAMRYWLVRARQLAARVQEHRDRLAELEAIDVADERERESPAAVMQSADIELAAFGDPDDRAWWRTTLRDLVAGIDALAADDPGGVTIRAMQDRLTFAETLRRRSFVDAAPAWGVAIREIEASPRYFRVRLSPQLGLVPLGADRSSGLFEFAHLQSGAVPVRDAATGKLAVDGSTCIVFVLVPGGTFRMGAQSDAADASNYDPFAGRHESPVHEIALEPFFLAKYETTQGQWLRLTGKSPSAHLAEDVAPAHPVEGVSFSDCDQLADRLGYGVVLPTEAQWEYGCRAGTDTIWWFGSAAARLARAGNVADASAQRDGAGAIWTCDESIDDGWVYHAPVGSFEPNAFGLHDVMGNVAEWCRDRYALYTLSVEGGEGERLSRGPPYRAARGGSYSDPPTVCRSAHRARYAESFQTPALGVRFARTLDP